MKNQIININQILSLTVPKELIDALLESYQKALTEFRKGNWSYFGNEIGRYIEISLRILEYMTLSKYTPLSSKLPIFNEQYLKNFEQSKIQKEESYRIIIPRQLYSMYCIRNKRGMIHINNINPNKMDATILLSSAKWVLAEFVRLLTNLGYDESIQLIESIINKELSIIWNEDDIFRILDTKLSCKEKILITLYLKNSTDIRELMEIVEYKNISLFRKILLELHKEKFIEYSNKRCIISPLGTTEVEKVFKKY